MATGISRIILTIIFMILLLFNGAAVSFAQLQEILILPVVVEGDADVYAERFYASLHDVLQQNENLSLLPQSSIPRQVAGRTTADSSFCLEDSCIQAIGLEAGTELVLASSISQFDHRANVIAWVLQVSSGQIVASIASEWRLRDDRLDEQVAKTAGDLSAKIVRRPGVIHVTTTPPQSSVRINGVGVGLSPLFASRPGGERYRVEVERLGFRREASDVNVNEGDTVRVDVTLRRVMQADSMQSLGLRLWLVWGLPIYETSVESGAIINGGAGRVLGADVSFGSEWRVRFGVHQYVGEIRNLQRAALDFYGAEADPEGNTTTLSASLVYALTPRRGGALFSMGLGATRRSVSITNSTGTLTYEAQFLATWQLGMGVEIPIWRGTAVQLEIVHNRLFTNDESWVLEGDDPADVWYMAFEEFQSYTMFRVSVGYRL